MEKHELCIMDRSGDTRLAWSPTIEEEVAVARRAFDRMRDEKNRYIGFAVDPDDPGRGRVLTGFDPTARKIVMTPPIMGG